MVSGPKRLSRMLHALSSVARLSVGMTMFPYSSGQAHHLSDWCITAYRDRRLRHTEKYRRPSAVSRKQAVTNGNDDEDDDEEGGSHSNVIVPMVRERCNSDVDLTSYQRQNRCPAKPSLDTSVALLFERLEMRLSKSVDDISSAVGCCNDADEESAAESEPRASSSSRKVFVVDDDDNDDEGRSVSDGETSSTHAQSVRRNNGASCNGRQQQQQEQQVRTATNSIQIVCL